MAPDLDTEPYLTERSAAAVKAPRLAQWRKWLADKPDVAGMLTVYRPVATINGIEIRTKAH
jgi:hypothetical protein